MSTDPAKLRQVLLALLAASTLLPLASLLRDPEAPALMDRSHVQYPELFLEAPSCSHADRALASARRSEELAQVRADRYPYDPADGIRAARLYETAEACYRLGGLDGSASRVRDAASSMTLRLNTDYAAARLGLARSLEQERWSAVLHEAHRLLRLTHHLGRNEYVEWLERILGRAAARATEASQR